MILEKRQRSPLHPDFYTGLFIHGNLGQQRSEESSACGAMQKTTGADIAMLWEQEGKGASTF